MAFAPSPNDGPLDDAERALLDGFYQGIAPRQSTAHVKPEGQQITPAAADDQTKVIAHPGAVTASQTGAAPDEENTPMDASDDPFAALKGAAGIRSTIDLPGPRSGYRVEETSSGNFTIEHLASGEEVRVSGVDYLRFSDLQLHREFLTRTNPSTPPQTAAEPATEHDPEPGPPVEAPVEEGKSYPAEASPDEEAPDTDNGVTSGPEIDYDSTFTAAEDGSITFSADDLLGGPSGPGGAGMRVVAVAGGGNGTLLDNGDDSWTFTPDEAFDGSVELEVTIADGQGGIETAMATIEITPAHDTPDTESQSPAASDDATMTAGSVVKPADDSGTMTYALVSGPAEGTVSVHADGSYSFDPGGDFEDLGVGEFRDVCFIYHATDGQGGSDSGIVTISVTGSEDGPVASERSLVTPENIPIAAPQTEPQPEPNDKDDASMTAQSEPPSEPKDREADTMAAQTEPPSEPNDREAATVAAQTEPQSEPNDKDGATTAAGLEPTITDADDRSIQSLDDGAVTEKVQDIPTNGAADYGLEDRKLTETPDVAVPEEAQGESPFASLFGDIAPRIDASTFDKPAAVQPVVSIGSGDNAFREDRVTTPQREPDRRAGPTSPSQDSVNREISRADAPIQPERHEPSPDVGLEKVSIQTDQGNEEPKSDHGDARVDEAKPNETIDLSTARNWTVTYANGDSFTANDTRDADLFTDTAGTIDFGNGDRVKFENVKQFTW